ncbi:MAG: DMT family transporter [Rhodospirillaceae bacterium]|jgi:drug/metabolite transporter (DMT)-like permease|nr:DMT family transporter [Rhodospirillaceae bacterium]MBT6116451.1 DMT family transporter [Rhodospirillaceae bacterium]
MPHLLRNYVLLGVLALTWGSGYPFIKVVVDTVPPATVSLARASFGFLVLFVFYLVKRERLPRNSGDWVWIGALALVGFVVPHILITWGAARIDSGLTAILVGSAAFFTILFTLIMDRAERPAIHHFAAIALGFSGIVVLVGPNALAGLGGQIWGQLSVVGGAACYGITYPIARRLGHLSPAVSGVAILFCASVVALPISLAVDRPWLLEPSALEFGGLVWLGVVSSGLGAVLFLRLVALTGPNFATVVNYLVPLVGVGLGVAVLGEAVNWNALIALALILSGMTVAGRAKRAKSAEAH